MKKNIRETLGELGYDVELKGAKYVEEVVCQMLKFINNEDEVNKLRSEMVLFSEEDLDKSLEAAEQEISDTRIVNEMLSRIHVDAYHFEYEIGRLLYLGRIEQFLNSNNDQRQKSTDLRSYDCVKAVDEKKINSSIMGLVNYFNDDYQAILDAKKEQEMEDSKVYVLRFDSITADSEI